MQNSEKKKMNNFCLDKSKITQPKTILITGGSSGIGLNAVSKLINDGHSLIIPCRNKKRADEKDNYLTKELCSIREGQGKISLPIMDLSCLKSVEVFCSEICSHYNCIDTLILNAGLQYTGAKEPKWSHQGFELTFAVNHLSHHYLFTRMLRLLSNSKNPRLIVTSSEVHNPETSGGRIGKAASLGSFLGLKSGKGFKMVDGSKIFSADKAYKDSKLCNLLLAKEIHSRSQKEGMKLSVIAWAPGLVIPRNSCGFFRYSRKYNELGQRIFALLARDIFRISDTLENAGKTLAKLATDSKYQSPNFLYLSNQLLSPGKFRFGEGTLSKEAQKENMSVDLWKLTDELIKDVL